MVRVADTRGPVVHAGDRGVSIGMVRCFPLADYGRGVVCKPYAGRGEEREP